MGIKPLYYWAKEGKIAFGSELKLLLSLPEVSKEISPQGLNHYLLLGYSRVEQSMLKEVVKLKPGYNLVFELTSGQIQSITTNWDISFQTEKSKEKDPFEELRTLLDLAVKRRMIADVPVGAFLSGGVDSSVIVSIMRHYVKDLKTFSVGFDRKAYDETKWSKMVAELLETDHQAIQFSSEDVKELLPRLSYHFDEPLSDPSMIPTYLVSQVASESVKVCLSGTGGDELFGLAIVRYH